MFLLLAACAPGPGSDPSGGVIAPPLLCLGCEDPPADDDGDGYTEAQQDCDDTDAAIGPFAEELPGDGVDQDCDHSDAPPARLDDVGVAWTGGPDAGAGASLLVADVDDVPGLDLVVGSSGTGTVSLLSGEGGPVEDATTVWTTRAGAVALAAGDVDGNGRVDLLVGDAWVDGVDGRETGAVYGWTAPVAGTMALSAAAARFEGEAYANLGGVVCAGDWDGDGVDDVAAQAADPLELRLYVGGASEPGARLARDSKVETATCLSSDLDADGREDLIVAASPDGEGGLVSVWTSLPTGDGALEDAPVVLRGGERNARFGAGIAAGDTDGDGAADLVVGAPGQDASGAQDAGEVAVFRGRLPAAGTPEDARLRVRGEDAWFGLGGTLTLVDVGGRAWLAAGAGYVPPDGLRRWPYASLFLLDVSAIGDRTSATAAAVFSEGLANPGGALLAAGDLDGDGIEELVVADLAGTSAARPDGGGVVWRVDVASVLVGE